MIIDWNLCWNIVSQKFFLLKNFLFFNFRPLQLPAGPGPRRGVLHDAEHPAHRLHSLLKRHHKNSTKTARKVLLHKT